jgi:hypothetical protein
VLWSEAFSRVEREKVAEGRMRVSLGPSPRKSVLRRRRRGRRRDSRRGRRRSATPRLIVVDPQSPSTLVCSTRRLTRSYLVCVIAVCVLVVGVLLLDRSGMAAQLTLGLVTTLALIALTRVLRIPAAQVVTAVLVATLGEVLLSMVWGLYSYRSGLLPLYVPPGHGVFYAIAAATAHQPFFQRHTRAIVRTVLVAGSVIALVGIVFLRDRWGLVWWLAAAGLLLTSRRKLLLSACFTWTMLLEWLGTGLGNWRWAEIVPGLGLRSANPPSGVGILYIVLDLIVVLIASGAFRDGPRTDTVPQLS